MTNSVIYAHKNETQVIKVLVTMLLLFSYNIFMAMLYLVFCWYIIVVVAIVVVEGIHIYIYSSIMFSFKIITYQAALVPSSPYLIKSVHLFLRKVYIELSI